MRSVFNSTILLTFLISSCAYAQTTAISMRSISGGQFQMGSPMSEFERQKDETQHQVSLSAFEIAPYEVSQSLYEEVMGNNPSAHVGKNLPVENITWYDAIRFCNALSQKEGLEPAYVIEQDNGHIKVTWNREASGYRLPTESEWEYAARAGTTTPFNTGENISADQANYYGTYPYRDRPSQTYRGETVPIGSFSTNTTANKVRNKNIQLACQAINGTILRPGEEFSFNNTVGERTEAKGYGAATAYNEGEVVQEVGGGICQVSTTLYNAVLKSGLKTTKRQSHTFEPNYVTPGMDATVSWGGPDYRFANVPSHAEYSNSDSYSIGIYAEYSNQKVTISIYGRPVLKDGYSYSLSSKKVKDIDVVRKLIEPGSDKKPTTGTKGSQWTTNLVVKKDGEVVSDKLDHNTYYSGHIEYYTDTPAATETSSPAETTTPVESSSENLPTDTLPQHETGISGGPGVTSAYPQAGPTGTTEAYGPGVPSQPAQTEPQTQAPTAPQTTAAPEAPQAPTAGQTTAGPTPGGTEAPQSPVSSGPISDAPPAL